MCLIFLVISKDHLLERSFEFIGGSSFQYITTCNKFDDHRHYDRRDIIPLICHMTAYLKSYVSLWVGSPSL